MSTLSVVPVVRTLLLPDWVVQSGWFAALAGFVAVNTVVYAALAVAKILPKVYVSDWFTSPNRRRQNRSIHPAGDPGYPGDPGQVEKVTSPPRTSAVSSTGPPSFS